MRKVGGDARALMTSDEACEYLNVDPPMLDKLRLESGLPFVRESPTEIRFPRGVLDDWLAERSGPA